MPRITAIETQYAGCRFRSRLEARWAVFFDHLSIEWQYEPEGFEVSWGDGVRRYLPDFHLPASETWVEVKGVASDTDTRKLMSFIDGESPIPGVHESFGTTRGVLLLGAIPSVEFPRLPMWTILQHHKGVGAFNAAFSDYGLRVSQEPLAESWDLTPPKSTTFACRWMDSRDYGGAWTVDTERAYAAARSARFEHGEKGATWR